MPLLLRSGSSSPLSLLQRQSLRCYPASCYCVAMCCHLLSLDCSCDSCHSCRYPLLEVSPPLFGVCACLVPSSLLFCSFVFFFFCFLNSNSWAASFSSPPSFFPSPSLSFFFSFLHFFYLPSKLLGCSSSSDATRSLKDIEKDST